MPGIPERFYRIAKHKLTEFKDRLDQMDEEAAERELQRETQKAAAQTELKEALEVPRAFPTANSEPFASNPAPRPRTPEEIARGTSGPSAAGGSGTYNAAADPLRFHYGLLGVEAGSDFVTVQGAYNKLAARSDPSRFPAGSAEEKEAQEIRTRLEESYKVLKEALDPTSRRFDMLEL